MTQTNPKTHSKTKGPSQNKLYQNSEQMDKTKFILVLKLHLCTRYMTASQFNVPSKSDKNISCPRGLSPTFTDAQINRNTSAHRNKRLPVLPCNNFPSSFLALAASYHFFFFTVNCRRRSECGNCSDKRLNFLVFSSKPKAAGLMVL